MIQPLPVLLCAVLLAGTSASGGASPQPPKSALSKPGACSSDGTARAGQRPAKISGKIRAPKMLRHVGPNYPKFPSGTVGSGMWMGEARIDTSGKVSQVWTIREVKVTPPFPAFNQAIVDAIRLWEFEPLVIDKVPVPVCMTVTVNINWQ